MPYKISELKTKWNKEKDHYRTREVGTGVQGFVKDMLLSEEVFCLKEGRLSTPLEQRKNEFIHERPTKQQRQADFVIYINPEIAIPVEAECYGNIKAGVKQLFNYQKDLEKKYGILTDGNTWRFYNNTLLDGEYRLDQIFSELSQFIEYWKEYIKPEYYYLSFFEKIGQLSLLKGEDKLLVEENRYRFFEDITTLIRSFKRKLQIEGYFKGLNKKEKEKKATEIAYAYIIQFILYKTLVDNDFGGFGKEFEVNVKKIPGYIKNKRYKDILGIIDRITAEISKDIYRPFAKEQDYIAKKILELYRIENKLSDVSPWLDIFVFIMKYNFQNIQSEIFGYIYENYLKELYPEGQKGQYFTDPAVVNFMLEQVGFTPKTLKSRYEHDKNSISLIDPACGSGTFLYGAVDRLIKTFGNQTEEKSKKVEEIVNNDIFGLDIAEFPLYLAEMNILMRMLPMIISEKYNNPVDKKIKLFLTKDSIAEFLPSPIGKIQAALLPELEPDYESFMREPKDVREMKQSLGENNEMPRRRYDYVIGNPPYVGYNECSKQKVLIFEYMKDGRAKLNNIYGVNLHSVPNSQKKYAPKPNLYVFFIALGIALLKDNGRLCYIIPRTLLTAGDLDVLRYHLAKFTTIEKIITFSGKMFVGRGLKQNKPVATSSLVFVVNRGIPPTLNQVEVINYTDPDDDVNETLKNILANKKVTKKKILQSELLQNVANWNFIRQGKAFLDFYKEYKNNTEDISIYYNHAWAELKFKSRFYFDIGFVLNPKEVSKTGNTNDFYELLDFKTFYNYSRFVPTLYYPKDRNKIKLTQNSQGYITLEQKYKIIWSVKNPDRFCFTDHPIIFYMGKASIICSNNRNEIFYLFSLLNCPLTKLILEAQLKSEQEKEYLIPIKAIKEFVRVPKITEDNQQIKDEIIKRTEEMLALEDKTLSDFIDFSKVMVQKFDSVIIKNGSLVLRKDEKEIKLQIKDNLALIKKIIDGNYGNQKLDLERKQILLADLKSLPIIDFERQKTFKEFIDDLVFALYFNVPLNSSDVKSPAVVRKKCSRNKFYRLVNSSALTLKSL